MSCSKLPYRSQFIALRALRAVARKSRRRNRKAPTGTYLCSECRCWQLTSKSGNQTPPWVRRRAARATG